MWRTPSSRCSSLHAFLDNQVTLTSPHHSKLCTQVLVQLANGVTNRGQMGGQQRPEQDADGPKPSTQVSKIDLAKGKKQKRGGCCSS